MPHPRFAEILEKMKQIHYAKDHDYAGEIPFANFRLAEKLGVPAWKAVMIRMSDKWSRLCTLATTEAEVKDESFEDTLLDLANYSIICLILKKEYNESVKDFIKKEFNEFSPEIIKSANDYIKRVDNSNTPIIPGPSTHSVSKKKT